MTLAAGSRLGPYEILAPLGAGGMGEVWRARDTKLGREVALKVLPAAFAQDRERLQRFEREAHLLAGLNHPNIAAIYGVEDQAGVHALVMELVPGETLAEILGRGALPLEDAVPIARQIAEALEEAHEHGIVHRDLKPQNIKLAPDGKVKVLDFGLAKALDPNAVVGSLSSANSPTLVNSPTLTAAGTQMGVLLGTAAYMSPEQAKGRPVDRRADIWAFGAVLWEMLSGKRLFEGDSVPETLGAIFRQEISLDALPRDMPPALRALLARCLERDPRSRLRDIGEARVLLQQAEAGKLAAPAAPETGRVRRGLSAPVWIGLAAAALVAGYLVGTRRAPAPSGAEGAGTGGSPSFQKLTSQPGVEQQPTLSPDGKTLYFAARRAPGKDLDIFFVPVGGKKPIDLTADSAIDDQYPAVSPDGSQVAFRSERAGGGVFLMGTTGESVRRLTEKAFDPAWSPDGRSIVVTTAGGDSPFDRGETGTLHIIDVATGTERTLETGDAATPAWSPHGRRIAYWGVADDEAGRRDVWTVAVEGGQPVEVTHDPATDWNPVWSADGSALYFLSDRGGSPNLWRIAIEEATGKPSGEPRSVVLPTEFALYFRIAGGRLVYTSGELRSTIERWAFDAERLTIGPPQTVLETTNSLLYGALSPDGRTLAYTTVLPRQDLFVVELDSGNPPVQLTDDPARDRWVTWDPDGSRVLFMSNRDGRYEIWGIRPDGSGLTQLTRTTDESRWFPRLSPDGQRLSTGSQLGTSIFDSSGSPPWTSFTRLPNPADLPGYTFVGAAWSRDGRQLAGNLRSATPKSGVAVYDFSSQTLRTFMGEDWAFAWLPDGRRLLVARDPPQGKLAVLDTATSEIRTLEGGPQNAQFPAASGDLRTLVSFSPHEEADVWLAENWE